MVSEFPVMRANVSKCKCKRSHGVPNTKIKNSPWLDDVSSGEDSTKQDAHAANDNIRNAEEGILAAHDGARADKDLLCAAEDGDVELVPDVDLVAAGVHDACVVAHRQLAEVRQSRRPHPHLEPFPLLQLRQRDARVVRRVHAPPVWWRDHVVDRVGCRLVEISVAAPRDARRSHVISCAVDGRVLKNRLLEGVVEE